MSKFTIEPIVLFGEGNDYNSFCSLEAADVYHGRRLNNSLWREADEDTRTSALFWATDILHRQDWIGNPVDYDQALAWPRRYVPNRLSSHRKWQKKGMFEDFETIHSIKYLDHTSIPQIIQDAASELALYLVARSAAGKDEVAQHNDQLSGLTLGGISMQFREEENYITDMPHQVYFMVKDFLNSITEGDPNILGASSVRLTRK